MPQQTTTRGPGITRAVLRWTLRAAEAALVAAGASLLYLGATSLWMIAQIFPWPWRPPVGAAGLAVVAMVGLMGAAGLLFTTLGGGLLAVVWLAMGRPRPRWRGRRAPTPGIA